MLASLKEVLAVAEARTIAIGAFNTPNLESLCAVIEAAEALELPVIVQFAQCHEEWLSLEIIGPIMVEHAKKASVPVCVHLDHGETLDYIRAALQMGFTSVMYDGSTRTLEDNIAETREAVCLAKRFGADVEAEVGSMGQREFAGGYPADEGEAQKIYTSPSDAQRFVAATGVQALACSFGTTHGIYLSAPRLDFEIVRQVRTATGGIPVVMHGGSGVSEDDFRSAILAGVRKINYFTYMDKVAGAAVCQTIRDTADTATVFYTALRTAAMDAMRENVKDAMRVFARMDA